MYHSTTRYAVVLQIFDERKLTDIDGVRYTLISFGLMLMYYVLYFY